MDLSINERKIRLIHEKKIACFFLFMIVALAVANADCYVSPPGGYGTNNPPYTNWADAATNIHWAVDVATNGETVWVTNGNYALTNQIVVTNGIVLKSVNGRTNTFINGNYPACSNRCFCISNASAVVDGFTMSNAYFSNSVVGGAGACIYAGLMQNCVVFSNFFYDGNTNSIKCGGAGVYLEQTAMISNCLVYGNVAFGYAADGGGVFMTNGGTVVNCVISNNGTVTASNSIYGGGMVMLSRGQVINSQIKNNRGRYGGGIYCTGGIITGCVVSGNYVSMNGNGIFSDGTSNVYVYSTVFNDNTGSFGTWVIYNQSYPTNFFLINCIVTNNISSDGIVFISGVASNCIIVNNVVGVRLRYGSSYLYNCVIECNSQRGILIAENAGSAVSCCTVASNYSSGQGGGIRIESSNSNVRISNCIIVSNTAAGGYNDICDATAGNIHVANVFYSCAGSFSGFSGVGNITNVNPCFLDFLGRNYRLSVNSPCINAGTNESWMANAADLDGRQRIRYGTVDMGAYETIYEGTVYRFGF